MFLKEILKRREEKEEKERRETRGPCGIPHDPNQDVVDCTFQP